jgi:predicted Zn finger-like uncharacterized protein
MTTPTADLPERAREGKVHEGGDHYLILECPNCKTAYRIDPSLFSGWKSARVRCRKCKDSFTVSVPGSEPSEPSGHPVSQPEPSLGSCEQPAGVMGVPVAKELAPANTARKELPPETPREVDHSPHPQSTPEESSGTAFPHPPVPSGNQDPRSWYWSLLVSLAIVVACGLALAGLLRVLSTRFLPM